MTKQEVLVKVKEGLAAKGLPLAEDAIEAVIEVFESVVVEYIETSESKMDDIALPIVKTVFEAAKKAADKIDGKEEKKA